MGYISLVEWAAREGIDSSTARHKAIKGLLPTAKKIGRNWAIEETVKNLDNRLNSVNAETAKVQNMLEALENYKAKLTLDQLKETIIVDGEVRAKWILDYKFQLKNK